MRHDRAFLGKAFDVLGFLRKVTQRNKEREVGVAMSGRTKHRVELALHVFPNPVAPWPDHHAAAAKLRMSTIGRTGVIEDSIEDVLAMFSRRQSIVND